MYVRGEGALDFSKRLALPPCHGAGGGGEFYFKSVVSHMQSSYCRSLWVHGKEPLCAFECLNCDECSTLTYCCTYSLNKCCLARATVCKHVIREAPDVETKSAHIHQPIFPA